MQVVILCGGMGTRLREETEFRPKPMVQVGTRPILWHIMKLYAHYGYKDFVLVLGYKGEMVKDYFCNYELRNNDLTVELGSQGKVEIHGDHDEVGWRVTLVDTGEKTLKGGRLKRVESYIEGDEFLLTYGDGVSNVDIDALLAFHRSHDRIGTVTGVSPASRFGEMRIQDDQVEAFLEKPPQRGEGLVSGGFFVLKRKFFDYLTLDEDCDLEYGPLETLAQEDQLMVHKHYGFWASLDTIRDRDYLNGLWESGAAEWKVW